MRSARWAKRHCCAASRHDRPDSRHPRRPSLQSRIAILSDRELEVFRLIGEGRATREIADELHLSIKTVETYQAHIKDKLALRSGRELIQHAIQWKINEKTA